MILDQENLKAIEAAAYRGTLRAILEGLTYPSGAHIALPDKPAVAVGVPGGRDKQEVRGSRMTADDVKRSSKATDHLLTSKEAASIVGTTASTLTTWRCKGKGPKFVKLGTSVRYRTSDLEAYIKEL